MPLIRDGQRHIPEGTDIVGNEFPFIAVAPGGAFQKFPVFVYELDGQAVQLQHEQCGMVFDERNQIAYQFGFVQGEQRDAVPYLFQAADSLIAHRLGGWVAQDDPCFFLSTRQLIIEMVIDCIGYAGGIFIVVFVAVAV